MAPKAKSPEAYIFSNDPTLMPVTAQYTFENAYLELSPCNRGPIAPRRYCIPAVKESTSSSTQSSLEEVLGISFAIFDLPIWLDFLNRVDSGHRW
jgi:hypothetical protein